MRKIRKSKIKLNKADKWRIVLTDTSPFEVPIIISNDGFYKNLHELEGKSPFFQKLIKALVIEDDRKSPSVPMRYNIVKDSRSVRTLSLLHPKGQVILASFYAKYEELICEYASRSPFSIRAPKKIGGSFFSPSPVEDQNLYKNATVDTTEIDKLVRNPASYFAYSGVSRLYQFFASDDHIRLEKKFRYQISLDISKCFDSIYTHSIAWATKSKPEAKSSRFSLSFGNVFDEHMRRLNDGETSGICIGPETSRIFAEIILARVDSNAEMKLNHLGLRNGVEYECRRYVDNFYIFVNDLKNAEHVEHEIALSLREYNLHLNDSKRVIDKRPFYSNKSLVIDAINRSLSAHWDQLFESKYIETNGKFIIRPKTIYRYRSLFGKITREIKAACYSSKLGYDSVSNYIIGAIRRKVIDLSDGYPELPSTDRGPLIERDYRQMLFFLLDIGFYFFTLHPTVASSLRLSHALVRAAQHLQQNDTEGRDILKEASLRWTLHLARAPSFEGILSKNSIVPIEILNILVSLQQLGGDGFLEHELIILAKLDHNSRRYFDLVVKLYIYGNRAEFHNQRSDIWNSICERINRERHLVNNSEAVHLLLDSLSCPHIETSLRADLLMSVWGSLSSNMGTISKSEAEQTVSEIELQHWFVRWDGIDLLNMIEKKELCQVYE